jgi:hypothetical protein
MSSGENLLEEHLKKLHHVYVNGQLDKDKIDKDWAIFKELRHLSILLNNSKETSSIHIQWSYFQANDLFKTFSGILKHFLNILKNVSLSEDNYDQDTADAIFRPLRDLLEIIYKLISYAPEFCGSFLEAGLFRAIIDFFDIERLLEFFYDNNITIFVKIIGIFYSLCKEISSDQIKQEPNFLDILRRSRDKIDFLCKRDQQKVITTVQESDIMRFKTYFIYVLKLVSLKYLENKIDSNEKLLEVNHYKDVIEGGFAQNSFKEITNEFCKNEEFLNEKNIREIQGVTRMTFINNSQSVANSIIEVLNNIKLIFTTRETKMLAYPKYSVFFKSVLYYGLDIERIICLNCLRSFCEVEEIRRDIFGDEKLVSYLNNIILSESLTTTNDEIKQRLITMIRSFFIDK